MIPSTCTVDITPDWAACVAQAIARGVESQELQLGAHQRRYLASLQDCLWLLDGVRRAAEARKEAK